MRCFVWIDGTEPKCASPARTWTILFMLCNKVFYLSISKTKLLSTLTAASSLDQSNNTTSSSHWTIRCHSWKYFSYRITFIIPSYFCCFYFAAPRRIQAYGALVFVATLIYLSQPCLPLRFLWTFLVFIYLLVTLHVAQELSFKKYIML